MKPISVLAPILFILVVALTGCTDEQLIPLTDPEGGQSEEPPLVKRAEPVSRELDVLERIANAEDGGLGHWTEGGYVELPAGSVDGLASAIVAAGTGGIVRVKSGITGKPSSAPGVQLWFLLLVLVVRASLHFHRPERTASVLDAGPIMTGPAAIDSRCPGGDPAILVAHPDGAAAGAPAVARADRDGRRLPQTTTLCGMRPVSAGSTLVARTSHYRVEASGVHCTRIGRRPLLARGWPRVLGAVAGEEVPVCRCGRARFR